MASTTEENELPSMEERTLFLGCLTHIVASSYVFDLIIEGNKGFGPFSSRSIGEVSSDDSDDDDEDVQWNAAKPSVDDEVIKSASRGFLFKEPVNLSEAEQRHCVRRYKVAREFLLNSVKHFHLDEASTSVVEKEFLPKLDALLEPTIREKYINNNNNNANNNSNNTKDNNPQQSPTKQQQPKVKQVLEHAEENAQRNAKKYNSSTSLESLDWVQDNETLQDYLERLDNTSAYQCLSCLLFQHLLHAGNAGYDARIRFWLKTLAVTLWIQQMERTESTGSLHEAVHSRTKSRLEKATRKFESLETCCSDRLLTLASAGADKAAAEPAVEQQRKSSLASNIWKGVQIGSVGVGAGILLAVTGGLAAPGIAAGLAALGLGAVAGTFLSLASSAAVVSLFGVAGGSLAAYKMNRRVSGLTEFVIHQELVVPADSTTGNDNNNKQQQASQQQPEAPKAQLFRTIGISGWVHDKSDFQRPWGITPTKPPIKDSVELLQRFYHVQNPDLVQYADDIWKKHNKDRDELWKLLKSKYGCTPDNPFGGKKNDKDKLLPDAGALTEEEIQQLDQIIVAIGNEEGGGGGSSSGDKGKEKSSTKDKSSKKEKKKKKDKKKEKKKEEKRSSLVWSGWGTSKSEDSEDTAAAATSNMVEEPLHDEGFEMVKHRDPDDKPFKQPEHLNTVWDYPKQYGGELYTVQWESDVLRDLSASIRDLALQLASSAGQQIMKTTVMSTLIFAAALPMTVIGVMNSIDSVWALVMERADQAGQELARSLLINKGGSRPVTLVGFSFGARIIYVCLMELAKYQQAWEDHLVEQSAKHFESDNLGKDNMKVEPCKVGDLEFDREPASIVEDVILMGMPKYLNLAVWKSCREVVAGRLVNVYSRKDKVLTYIFKYRNILGSYQPVVGNGTVAVPGVENIDVTDLVGSHAEYSVMIGRILQRVRHGQPVRSSSHALDEVALIEEAQSLVKEAEAKANGAAVGGANSTDTEEIIFAAASSMETAGEEANQ